MENLNILKKQDSADQCLRSPVVLLAAVDQNALTVDIGCAFTCQKCNDLADLVRLRQTVGGVVFAHGFLYVVGNSVEHLGLCCRRSHAVNSDTLAGGFLCQSVGKTYYSRFGGGVVALTGVAACCVGAEIDNAAVAVVTHLLIDTVRPVEDAV